MGVHNSDLGSSGSQQNPPHPTSTRHDNGTNSGNNRHQARASTCTLSRHKSCQATSHRLPKPNFVINPPAWGAPSLASSSGDLDRDRSFSFTSHPGDGFWCFEAAPFSKSTSLCWALDVADGLAYIVPLRLAFELDGTARGVRGGTLRPVRRREARLIDSRIFHCRFFAMYQRNHMPAST